MKYASIASLKKAREFFQKNPEGAVRIDWATTYNAKQYNRWFLSCLNAKINRNEPQQPYRKLSPEWQQNASQISRRLTARNIVRVREVPADLRPRLMHRLYTAEELSY